MKEQEIITLENLSDWVNDWLKNCKLNNVRPSDVEFFILHDNKEFRPFSGSLRYGKEKVSVGIEYFYSDRVRFDPTDERPIAGEYWKSRGPSSFDVSGFISSKPAGERLLRMVKYILETDETKSRLDWREFEPNWIQFKFSAEEFDVKKLDELATANGDIITEQIVRMCVLNKRDS